MKLKKCLMVFCLALLLSSVTSCGAKRDAKNQGKTETPSVNNPVAAQTLPPPAQLPVRYQSPGFVAVKETPDEKLDEDADGEYQLKVGATIRSTGGPQPLENVLNRLANTKGMTVSFASDVNQYTPVNVNISADEFFFKAIENLLRQADYFHEVNGKTIIVRNKETKVYQVGVPAMKGQYTSTVGGNFLADRKAATGTEGNVKIKSEDNKFDIWENIEQNLKVILAVVTEGEKFSAEESAKMESDRAASGKNVMLSDGADVKINVNNKTKTSDSQLNDSKKVEGQSEKSSGFKFANRQTSRDGEYFVVDKSIGLITVSAKPVNLKRVDEYIGRLKKELFRQVAIEAKIIEVLLTDNSKIGLDWSSILKDFPISGTATFGANGLVYPSSGSFVSAINLNPASFTVLLNALKEQGDTHVLANPKLTVLNGQPALISVGKDIAYVKSMTRDVDTDTNEITFTAEVDNVVQGIALGVMASILDENKVVLHLTPITTDVENVNPDGSIVMTSIGDGAIELGLPQVRVREMSTMVQVEDGEMLIIGGLIDSIEENSGKFAPGVGSLPIVKYLFGVEEKTKQKRELVILLTPRII